MLSQDDKPQSHQSLRQITCKTGVSLTSVHRIVKRDLSLKCVKRRRAQELTAANKVVQLARCRELLCLYPPEMVQMMWFTVTDDKLISVAAPSNKQNDRCYVESFKKKKEVDTARTRPTYSKSLMVSVGVSCLGRTDVHFLQPGVKVDGEYYRDVVLKEMLLPDIKCTFLVMTALFSSRTAHQHIEQR